MYSAIRRALCLSISVTLIITAISAASVSQAKTRKDNGNGETAINPWLQTLEKTADDFRAHRTPYSGSSGGGIGTPKVYRVTNCAGYISQALYNYGLLDKGDSIWLSYKINGKAAKKILSNTKDFTVTYPNKVPSQADLQPGDICGFAWGRGGIQGYHAVHTMAYAGNDLWYSFESSNAGVWKEPETRPGYRTRLVRVLIRINNINQTYDINTSKTGKGKISASRTVAEGEDVEVKYKPAPLYSIGRVKIDGKVNATAAEKNSWVFKDVKDNHTVEVEFIRKAYLISTSVSGGQITPDTGVQEGESIGIRFKPYPGYVLESVSIDGQKAKIDRLCSSVTFANVFRNHSVDVKYKQVVSLNLAEKSPELRKLEDGNDENDRMAEDSGGYGS